MRKILLLLLLCLGQTRAQESRFTKIDSLLTFLNQNNKFMGSLAIRSAGKTVFAKAYGFSDLANAKKLDNETQLKIGSITKTFTATMVMQLIEEKKLSLSTPLSRFFPKIANADKITIHHLLHHRSGIPDFLNDDPNVAQYIYLENKREDLLKRMEAYQPAFAPNAQYAYSNSNYNLLGYIIEDITRKSFAQNLQDRIINKLGLKHTGLHKSIDPNSNQGFSFTFDGKKWEKTPEWSNSLAFAAGAIASTPSDLNLFMETLQQGRLVKQTSLEQMKALEEGYGKGLIVAPFDGRKFYGHTGGIENFRAAAGYNPDDQTGFAIIVNGDNYDRNDIMIGVLSLYYGLDYQFPDLKGFKVPEAVLQSYTGNYAAAGFPLKITITLENGLLLAQATGQSSFALTAQSETVFVFDPAQIKLTFAAKKMTLEQGGMKVDFIKE